MGKQQFLVFWQLTQLGHFEMLLTFRYSWSFMRHSNIPIPLAIHNGGSIFKMADQLEIHEGENGVICKLFSPFI